MVILLLLLLQKGKRDFCPIKGQRGFLSFSFYWPKIMNIMTIP
jgi:hypothetical protein